MATTTTTTTATASVIDSPRADVVLGTAAIATTATVSGRKRYADLFAQDVATPGRAADVYTHAIARESIALENVVANVGFGIKVNNLKFSTLRPNAYFQSNFGADAVVRFAMVDQTAVLLFNSGSVVVVGSRSSEQTIQAIHRLRLVLIGDGVHTGMAEFDVVNMVHVLGVAGIAGIDLAHINAAHPHRSLWKPKKFPGLRLVLDVEQGTLLLGIFDTLKIVLMGARSRAQIRTAMKPIFDICTRYAGPPAPSVDERYKHRLRRYTESQGADSQDTLLSGPKSRRRCKDGDVAATPSSTAVATPATESPRS